MVLEVADDTCFDVNEAVDEGVIVMYPQRLETFGEKGMWFEIGSASRQNMAKHGFFCQNEDERKKKQVHCTYCRKEFANWTRDDDPRKRHEDESPDCPFMKYNRDEEDLTVKEFLQIELAVKIAIMEEDKRKAKEAVLQSFAEVENATEN